MHASTERQEYQGLAMEGSSPLTSTEAVLWMIERDPALRSTIMAPVALGLLWRTSDTWPVGLLGPASRRVVHHKP